MCIVDIVKYIVEAEKLKRAESRKLRRYTVARHGGSLRPHPPHRLSKLLSS